MDQIQILNERFKIRYAKIFQELNANVVELALDQADGYYFYYKPTINIIGTGVTIANINHQVLNLNKSAKVELDYENTEPVMTIVRTTIPSTEIDLLVSNQAYFNLTFDKIVDTMIKNYNKELGGHDILRYGKDYLNFDSLFFDDSGNIELRLSGNLASNNKVTKG